MSQTHQHSSPRQAHQYISNIIKDFKPEVGIILGSGLAPLVDAIDNPITIDYADIPGFYSCSIEGHQGHLHFGMLKGVPVVCMQGRAHYYEGIDNQDIVLPIRTMKLLGVTTLIATNASGSMMPEATPGSLMLINDHINFTGRNPLINNHDPEFGPRFIEQTTTYTESLRDTLKALAKQNDITLFEGVYFGVLGPIFETAAEVKAYRTLGGDCVGMSTVPEVICAHHCGMQVAVISVITNMAAGMSDTVLSHQVTLQGAKLGVEQLIGLISHFLEQRASQPL